MDPETIKQLRALGLDSPDALQRIIEGFARSTKLNSNDESKFQAAVKQLSTQLGRRMNPDDPTYDMRAAYQAGFPGGGGHLESTFKGLGDDRLMLPLGKGGELLDTRTMQKPGSKQMIDLWRIISQVMNAR